MTMQLGSATVASPRKAAHARLNLGCGQHPHPAFVNVDLIAFEGVIAHDLAKGIPFPDGTFDLVYHSTMLSHLRPHEAAALTRECWRVLKPNGVLRVVTEDLEVMCRTYLQKLEEAWAGDDGSAHDYDWMILELYDQATRESSGGRMAKYVQQQPLPNEEFVCSRTGEQGRAMVAAARARSRSTQTPQRLTARQRVDRWRAAVRDAALAALLGRRNLEALEAGKFRLFSGQVSHQMYDRFSLKRLFTRAGLTDVALRSPQESAYPAWGEINVDVTSTGAAARPHALIMEGIRR